MAFLLACISYIYYHEITASNPPFVFLTGLCLRTPSRPRGDYDVVIVGGGVAGLSAALQARRRGLTTALPEAAMLHGGQVATVEAVEGWTPTGKVSAPTIIAEMVETATRLGVEMHNDRATSIETGVRHTTLGEARNYRSRSVIIAAGGTRRSLGLDRETQLLGRGISLCASCDGPLCRGKDVVVVGGGDAALQETELLSKICKSVTIVVRGALRARRSLIDDVCRHGNVRFAWDSEVSALLGADGLTGLTLRNVKNGTTTDIECYALFPLIGSTSNGAILPSSSGCSGAVPVHGSGCETGTPGIHAIGAVRDGFCGDLASAAGDAAAAVAAIARRLAG